jgi:hypothetical protein
MFGYIVPEKPELKIKEYELFRAYYCGICKSIGKKTGQINRFVLSYDVVFLAVLLSAIWGKAPDIYRGTCILHPLKKRSLISANNIIEYVSEMNVILAYYNLKDKLRDEASVKFQAGMLVLEKTFRRMKKKYLEKCGIIECKLNELSVLEEKNCASLDMVSEQFAKIMEEVFRYKPVCENKKNDKILGWIGYNTGKWIYVIDAYNDIEDDIDKGNYNVLTYQYGFNRNNEDVRQFKERIREKVAFNLTYCLNQIAKAYELLEIKRNSGIMENIIYMGMLRKTEQITGTGGKNFEESL